ncbi:unnamed protein product, partial [Amoebophrya sp. A25]
ALWELRQNWAFAFRREREAIEAGAPPFHLFAATLQHSFDYNLPLLKGDDMPPCRMRRMSDLFTRRRASPTLQKELVSTKHQDAAVDDYIAGVDLETEEFLAGQTSSMKST